MTRATTAASALSFLQKTFDLTSWQHITMSTEGTTTATGGTTTPATPGTPTTPGTPVTRSMSSTVPIGYGSNLCCGATEVYNANLVKTSASSALTSANCQGLTSVRIIPFATYTKTEVHFWLVEFLYAIGGVLELMIYCLLCFVLIFRCFLRAQAAGDELADDGEPGGGGGNGGVDLEIAAVPKNGGTTAAAAARRGRGNGTRM